MVNMSESTCPGLRELWFCLHNSQQFCFPIFAKLSNMGSSFKPKNKMKREKFYQEIRKKRTQQKLKRRQEILEEEKNDKKKREERLAMNVPRTLDNTREYDPSMLTANLSIKTPSTSTGETSTSTVPSTTHASAEIPDQEVMNDISTDPFAPYFNPSPDSDTPMIPKVIITTSQKATRATYDFGEELAAVFPGAEFRRRPKGQGFEIGRIARWAAKRGYGSLIVINEDRKIPNAITLIHLPSGPSAYFKLTSIELTKDIYGHARATSHYPELILNNFVTRLGHTVGRMFQTLFPPLPEFQGRQVVTLHNQRDFLFFRRHRYAFRSTEKAALQEIGPRFTLKLRWLKKGLPGVGGAFGKGEHPPELEISDGEGGEAAAGKEGEKEKPSATGSRVATGGLDEYEWVWKPELETTRRTFFL